MAAAIESYYRSALNAMLNARLLGAKASYFPNMHVQVSRNPSTKTHTQTQLHPPVDVQVPCPVVQSTRNGTVIRNRKTLLVSALSCLSVSVAAR